MLQEGGLRDSLVVIILNDGIDAPLGRDVENVLVLNLISVHVHGLAGRVVAV